MFQHTFALNLEETRRITIVQAQTGEEAKILYNKKPLGVATSESLLSGCNFTLSEGDNHHGAAEGERGSSGLVQRLAASRSHQQPSRLD